jgi:unsaturated pyranuronate lyase
MSAFGDLSSIPARRLGEGYLARAVHGSRVTFAVLEIEPHAELPEHSHENEQLGMVISGSVTFRVGEEERELGPGATWTIPSGTRHLVRAGAQGAVVLDVFAPAREDFWEGLETAPAAPPAWP